MTLLNGFWTAVALVQSSVSGHGWAASDQIYFEQLDGDISIGYEIIDTNTVKLTSLLPAGWQFVVSIDGDQDGRWGTGVGPPKDPRQKADDRQFGWTKKGAFCAQYVLTGKPNELRGIYASSICGAMPSKGAVKIGDPDNAGRTLAQLEIPADEFFHSNGTAHIQLCLLDTKSLRQVCNGSPSEPLILNRSGS